MLPTPGLHSAEVDTRAVNPGYITGTSLVGHYFAHLIYKVAVESGRHVDGTREKRTTGGVGGAMHLVETIHGGDTEMFY